MKKPSAFQQVMSMAQERLSPAFDNARMWGTAFGFKPATSQQRNADVYQKVVEARQLQAMGQIHDDPRQKKGFTYTGLLKPTIAPKQSFTMISKGASPSPSPSSSPSPTPSPTKMPLPTATPTFSPGSFEQIAAPILKKYGIPLEVGFGMRDAEGGKIGAHNVYNIGAVDSNPTNAANYISPEQGVEAYAKLLSGKYKLANGQYDTRYIPAYNLRNNPEEMLKLIMQLGYAGDPKTWKQRSIDTGGAGKIYDSYAQFVMNTPGWKKYAKRK